MVQEDGSGAISETTGSSYLKDLQVSVDNSLTDEAMAFSRLKIQSDIDNPSETTESPYNQFNFQVSFNLSAVISQSSSIMSEWDGTVLSDEDVDNLYSNWKKGFALTVDPEVDGKPVYVKDGQNFLIGRQDHVYDRVVPFFGSYRAEDFINSPSDLFQIKILKSDTNLKDFVIGLMLEKSYFETINVDTNVRVVHKIYTGKTKFVSLIKTEDENDSSNYFIIREFPQEIDITTTQSLTFLIGYTKIESAEVVNILDKYSGSYASRYAGTFVFCINDIPKFSHGFVAELSDAYNYFDLGFGIPYGGYYVSDKMLLSKLTIFDDLGIDLSFSDIEITSPTYTYNPDLVYLPSTIKDWSKLRVLPEVVSNPSDYDDYDSSFSYSNFSQFPITFDGINQSSKVDGGICGDIHIVWEGNKDYYWNIYTTNSADKLRPFRFDTQITDTQSNSLMPDISVARNGKRMITWHDNRDGKYNIYAARSLSGYSCTNEYCRAKMVEGFSEYITECSLSDTYTALASGTYHFQFDLYTNNDMTNLYKTISSEGGVTNWYVNGSALSTAGASLTGGLAVTVSYIPVSGDNIFDKVLYIKLSAIEA
jgi:hypothetical protein